MKNTNWIKKEGNWIVVKGNFLKWYNENDDHLGDCPFIQYEGLSLESIDEEEIILEPVYEEWYVRLLDAFGNVDEELEAEFKLVEIDHGERRPLIQGTLEELVEYLKKYYDIFNWILEKEPDHALPDLHGIATIRDLRCEIKKADIDYWKLEIEEIKDDNNIIAEAGKWKIMDCDGIAITLHEKFRPDLYDLDEKYKKLIDKIIKDDKDFYIMILDDEDTEAWVPIK